MTKKPKIYMFVYLFPPEYTGAAIQALNLAKKLRHNGIDVTFVTATPLKNKKGENKHEGFSVIRMKPPKNNSNLSLIRFWFDLFLLLITHYKRYNIIHVIGIFTVHNMLSLYGKLIGKKTIVKTTLSNEIEILQNTNSGRENKFNLFAIAHYDKLIAISHDIVSNLKKLNINNNQIVYIPNGVNLKKFKPLSTEITKENIKKELNLPANGMLYSYIGVLHSRKCLDWLILNWLEYFKNKKNSYLLIAGPLAREHLVADGGGANYFYRLKRLRQDLDGEEMIFFRPFKKNVEQLFQISDFFINPSASEGLSNALLEAMACGVIPIVSRTSGSEDVIDDKCNGYIFDFNDSQSFFSALSHCYNNSKKQKEAQANAARKTIKTKFDIDSICLEYSNTYKSLLSIKSN